MNKSPSSFIKLTSVPDQGGEPIRLRADWVAGLVDLGHIGTRIQVDVHMFDVVEDIDVVEKLIAEKEAELHLASMDRSTDRASNILADALRPIDTETMN